MATLSTTPITFFIFFSELMFSNRFSFHMSGDDDITCYTNSLDARRDLRVVVELDLGDVADVVGVESDAVIEDVEVYVFGRRSGEEVGILVTDIWKVCGP
ncbi:hypothetical protein AHAS_Ahas15G0164000 [Arachis hypogaea]